MGRGGLVVTPWGLGRPVGILGGTFDPVHYGHLAVATRAREDLDLAGVLFVPASTPPHKLDRAVSPAVHRLAMVELAIADDPWFRASRVELDRPGPSYAIDTVTAIAAEGADEGREEPYFILSVEAFRDLPTWRHPHLVVERCRLAVVPRLGSRTPGREWIAEHFPGAEDRFTFLDGPSLGHSATDLRARVAAGRSIRYMVPPAVERYIGEHRLYEREA